MRAPAKCKFFVWLVLHDRCWTADRRKRHGLQDDDTCVLCNQMSETIDHLLLGCPFSREIWFKGLRRLSWEAVTPNFQISNIADWWTAARKSIPKDVRRCFDSFVVLVCWLLWKERNNRTFDRRVQTIQDVYVNLYRSTKRRASSARRFLASRVASVMCWCPIAPLLAASLALLATCAISLRASDAEGLTRWERGSALRAKQIGRCCVASGGLCTFPPIHRVSLAWSDFLPALCLCDVCQSLVGPIEICSSLPTAVPV